MAQAKMTHANFVAGHDLRWYGAHHLGCAKPNQNTGICRFLFGHRGPPTLFACCRVSVKGYTVMNLLPLINFFTHMPIALTKIDAQIIFSPGAYCAFRCCVPLGRIYFSYSVIEINFESKPSQ